MSNHIVEENPSAQPAAAGAQGADQKIKKQARQLAYDVRYKVKQGFKEGQKADPVSLKRAYLSQLGKSPAPGPVKAAAKKMLVGESYEFVDITDTVKSSISDVLNSVFTLGGGKKEEEIVEADLGKKFKVRVKDKKTGRSYIRMADRAKISELRKNPNIASVEMTGGSGTPYEGEKKKGAATASVKSGKGIPGDIEKVKEEFIAEVGEKENPDANDKKIDIMKGKNKVTINPTQSEQVETDQKEEKPKMDPKEKRVGMMKRMILQKKMQAVRSGAGADIVAHTELEGEVIAEGSLKQARKNIGMDPDKPSCWDGYKAKGTKMKGGKSVPNCVKEEELVEKKAKKDYDGDGKIESGKDEYFGSKDKAIKKAMKKESMKEGYGSKKKKKKSYGESTNKLGLKSWQSMLEGSYGEIDRPVEKESDTPEVKADVCFDAGAAIPTTIKGTGDPRELPTAINLMKNKYRAQGIMASKEPDGKLVEGMATPESGTGKYYNEKKPTAMQLAKRKKMDKVKSLTNQGKHKEASALYKEGIDVIKDILTKEVVDEKISASGYARAKKWREDQARAKDKKEQEHYANKAKTHKWDGEKWNKRES
tara:strand:- start:535 stop:2313 length:1779 start_codon:yes stop_codon:yes gene_type:complete